MVSKEPVVGGAGGLLFSPSFFLILISGLFFFKDFNDFSVL